MNNALERYIGVFITSDEAGFTLQVIDLQTREQVFLAQVERTSSALTASLHSLAVWSDNGTPGNHPRLWFFSRKIQDEFLNEHILKQFPNGWISIELLAKKVYEKTGVEIPKFREGYELQAFDGVLAEAASFWELVEIAISRRGGGLPGLLDNLGTIPTPHDDRR